MKKVCVITSTRAEYGLLKPVIKKINEHSDMQLQIIVTGTHLEPSYGYTVKEIENDGFSIDSKVKIVSDISKIGIIETMSNAMKDIGKELDRLNPDLIVIDGDRYEMPPVALAANVLGIPIAHIGGGDITEGAYDDSFRHTLTKLSTLHFPSTDIYRNRIIQMGEEPSRVFNVGSTGVENILEMQLLEQKDLEDKIGFSMARNTILVTFHPVTHELNFQEMQFKALLDALEEFKFNIIFTRPNADTNRNKLNDMIDEYIIKSHNNCIAFESMGLLKYLSAMKYCVGVVGNSSSGIYEAPSFKIGTINIGNRQKGRIKAESVIDCESNKESIINAFNKILSSKFLEELKSVKNPYEGINTSTRIADEIFNYLAKNNRNYKKFYDLEVK